MSWDVILARLPDDFATRELPDDFAPPPLGPREGVLAAIRNAVPETDLSDPSWGCLDGDVLAAIFRFAHALQCRVYDISAGRMIGEGDAAGWHAFQAYRDQVIKSST